MSETDDAKEGLFGRLGMLVEEKLDGANSCIHFEEGRLILRSRGDEIRGGSHPQWDLFKSWASAIEVRLRERIRNRYAVYGEWLYAEHNLHYRALPHYFMEFDVLDKEAGIFLDTERRADRKSETPYHPSRLEGLYFKLERDGQTIGRAKWVRPEFVHQVMKSEHWSKMSVTTNQLTEGVDIWS